MFDSNIEEGELTLPAVTIMLIAMVFLNHNCRFDQSIPSSLLDFLTPAPVPTGPESIENQIFIQHTEL